MPKGRRAIRVVFNTYYPDDAERIIESLRSAGLEFTLSRSRVVPELYYIDINVMDGDLGEARRKVEEIIRSSTTDRVFGLKIYTVDASR